MQLIYVEVTEVGFMNKTSKRNFYMSLFSLSPLQITDMEIMKEATPSYYIDVILPILQKNGIVHFLGFGNRLGFDPLPPYLQVRI